MVLITGHLGRREVFSWRWIWVKSTNVLRIWHVMTLISFSLTYYTFLLLFSDFCILNNNIFILTSPGTFWACYTDSSTCYTIIVPWLDLFAHKHDSPAKLCLCSWLQLAFWKYAEQAAFGSISFIKISLIKKCKLCLHKHLLTQLWRMIFCFHNMLYV